MHVPEPLSKVLILHKGDCWVPINRRISRVFGRKAADFIQSLHYWLTTKAGAIINGIRWVYNTYEEWSKQLDIPTSTLRALIYLLEKAGIILSGNFNKKKSDRTKWYTLDYDALKKFIGQEEGGNESSSKDPVDNSSSPCAENEHITTNRLTTKNTVLNNARAREPFFAKNDFEYNPPETESTPVEKTEEVLPSEPLEKTEVVSTPAQSQQHPKETLSDEEILRIFEEINPLLPESVKTVTPVLRNTIRKRLRSHFGQGETGCANLKAYLTKCANNAFLMGQKAMKNGTLFVAKMAFLLSPKTIEASWENAGVFNIYPPKKTPETFQEGTEGSTAAGLEADALPVLSLEDVLQTAVNETDKRVKERLYQTLGAVTYRVWLYAGEFVAKGLSGGEPDFFINSLFARDYVLTHYENQLKGAFQAGETGA